MAFATPAAAELPVPSAVWASMGGATRQVIGNNMTIKQETDRVILNWDKFNVSANSSVNFKQPSASAIALNKIGGQDPSKILGTVTANGQIYLLNKNGFVFGKDSVVNVHGLVASTLDVSKEVFEQGITKVADIDGRAAFEGSGEFYQKNDDGSFKLGANGKKIPISIKIESGARIKSGEGGRILVMAPTIVNSGSVESSGGQVIMAAATDKVYLQEAPTDENQANSDVRGLLVEVKTGGKVENLGNIQANRGNVTLMGFAVNQNGKVSASTSTNVNGTIRLLAREGGSAVRQPNGEIGLVPASTTRNADKGDGLGLSAKVTLGKDSRTEILPEVEYTQDAETKESVEKSAIDGQKQPQSRIEIMAHKVHLKSGSEIVAPGGKVQVTATKAPANPVGDNSAKNDSRVLIDAGAKVDVSGTDTAIKSMESNIIEVELRNFELKDAPLQKNGLLKGKTVLVDMREGTPLTDIQPSIDAIKRTVAERLSKGGDIDLKSEGDVVVAKGSVLDFSGGEITFLDGVITTSKLLTNNGRLVDISKADPLLSYTGLYGEVVKKYEKWGITRVWKIDGPFTLGRFEKGYVEGQDAGSLSVRGNSVVLDGDLLGHATNGRRQRSLDDQARGGSLTVNTGFSFDNAQAVIFSGNAQTPIDLDIDELLPSGGDGMAVALAVQAGKLFAGGIRDASFISNGKITVSDNAKLKLVDGGSLSLKGGAIDVRGDIVGAGASVDLATAISSVENLDGDITVAKGAEIRLQGDWVNDFVQPENLEGKSLAIDGGSFSAKAGGNAGGNVELQAGSLVDVSGGAWLKSDRKLVAGDAGSISLVAKPGVDNVGANVTMAGVLNAYGIEKGGRFTVKANAVAIRREEKQSSGGDVKPLQIATSFFGKGGFAEYDIGSNLNGLTVEQGASIELSQRNRILNAGYLTQRNGTGIEGFSQVASLLPLQRAPSKLTLRADHSAGSNAGSQLLVGRNASIKADDLSNITLESDASLVFDGKIEARGGTVAMNIVPDLSGADPKYQQAQGIWLGSNAKIDVSGDSEIAVDGLGHRQGKVYDGGDFVVNAQRGFFAARAGSSINVSGSQALVDLPVNSTSSLGVIYQSTLLGSHAGKIDITSAEGVFLDGRLQAQAGSASGTAGGTLSVSLNTENRRDPDLETGSTYPGGPRTIVVSQQKNSLFSPAFDNPGEALPAGLNGKGYLAAKQVKDGGFSSLALAVSGNNGEIRFQGDIDLQLKNAIALDAVQFGWERKAVTDTGKVLLTATTASLGSDTFRTPSFNPVNGAGQLTVKADLIDLVGGAVTSGFNSVNLAANGDIRLKGIRISNDERDFVGQFKTYSKLNLTADQVYPTSLTAFTLGVAGDPDGTVTFNQGGSAAPVLSALGKLTVQAPNIVQNGTLSAPLGEINLDAINSVKFGAHSVTTVSAKGQIVPLGVTQGGLEWLLPLAGTGNNLNVVDPGLQKAGTDKKLIFEAPQKKITVKADKILRDDGALVDLSGGGDLLAYEFIPGSGGSRDVLDSDKVFAVLPGISSYAPFDPKTFPDSGLKTGDSIFIAGGSGLAAGEYALLPARYALLPGAFLVTPLSAGGTVVAGSARSRVDGAPVVSGYRTVAGTDIRDQNWSEFVIEAGSIARTRSEYNISYASEFFAARAQHNELAIPRLPQDAGQLVLDAHSRLDLPTVRADVANGGRGGLVDIVSNNLSVVTRKSAATDGVELLASDIDKFKVDSLLLGAVRSFDAVTGNIKLDVKAKSVTVAEDTTLKAPELLLAATDTVELKQGARVEAAGSVAEDDAKTVLEVSGDGALLRASAGGQASIKRTGSKGLKGDLLINDDAVIAAGNGAILLDSTRRTVMDGELELTGGSLSMGAEAINLGETAGVVSGLSLDNRQLSRLVVDELVLTSRSMVNIYGQLAKTDANGHAVPLAFGNLVIDAAGLAGQANAGKTALLNAKTVTFTNNAGVSGGAGNGSGSLNISAEQLVLGKGNYQLSGFNQVNFNLSNGVTGRGDATLTALGDLAISAPFLTAEHGAKTIINATGHNLSLNQAGLIQGATTRGIGAQLQLIADSVALNTALLYKTGNVLLQALQGDVTLGGKALIDVSGAIADAGLSKPINLSAGKIDLVSQKQQVIAEAGSKMLLNGINAEMSAGLLTARAANGQVQLNGSIDAHGIGKVNGGRIAIDTGSLSTGGFGGLNGLFADSGSSGGVELRLRSGDIVVDAGQVVDANAIYLVADSGKIGIAGTLDARGANGGSVLLATEDSLTLESSARILAGAQAPNGDGGKVTLSAVDEHGDGAGIEIANGARIDVAAAGNGNEGEVYLRADRKDSDGDGIEDIDIKAIAPGAISGDADVSVEAAQIAYDNSVNQADMEAIHAANQNYMDGLASVDVAGNRFGNGFTIIPDAEVRSVGDLRIAESLDLSAMRYGNTPGKLTLRAAGNLLVENTLSDAFTEALVDLGEFGFATVSDFLQSGQSWSYKLVAGADLTSADNMAVMAGSGDVKLSNDVKVRTGTGDIDIRAGRDIVYGNNNSVIYTAGRPDDANRWGFSQLYATGVFYAEYPLDGGDISLNAGRDIIGKPTTQLVSDWLVHTGNWSRNETHGGETPTAWGIAMGVSDFTGIGFTHQQSVAALGGGNVSISAGGNINDLSVAIPTTGKQVGEKAPSDDPANFDYLSNKVEINGGGNLQLIAGGDIAGGVFYVDGGTADLRAAGSLKAGTNKDAEKQGLSPILALGDSQFRVTAGRDIALEAIIDPMFIPRLNVADSTGLTNQFFRYSADSAVNLVTLSGNITLENDASSLDEATNANISIAQGTINTVTIYPSSLKAYALHGDININGSLNMYPSAQGGLELFAANNIAGNGIVHMSDADPDLLPTALHPVADAQLLRDALNRLDSTQAANLTHAAVPLHADDEQPVLISTGTGNIAGNSSLTFVLAKTAEVSAGKDVANTSFRIQHNSADANSIIQAGRDIRFVIPINKQNGTINPVDQRIEIAGPGSLTALAGRNVDLGSSAGIKSIGDQFNTALADDGADITVVAGLAGGQVNVNGFAEKYLSNPDKYLQQNQVYMDRLLGEMRTLTGNRDLTAESASAAFNALAASDKAKIESKLLDMVRPVFFNEIKLAGGRLIKADTKQGQDQAELELLVAIETLFPGTTLLTGNDEYSVDSVNGVVVNSATNAGAILNKINAAGLDRPKLGNISLFFSTVQTVDGGDVNMITPNGGITAGLAADIGLDKEPSELGVIVQKQGEINALTRDNFDVNIARVMTLGGGGIMAGSIEGNVDAGRGAKTALSAPAPKVSFDEKGNLVVELPPVLAGSGIRTIGNDPGPVLLFAPRGIIDAGEAGIAGGRVDVWAPTILNGDNVDASGGSNLPVAPTSSVAAGLTGVSNMAAAVGESVDSAANVGKEAANTLAKATAALGMLSVDVLGFGEGDPVLDNRKSSRSTDLSANSEVNQAIKRSVKPNNRDNE